MKSKIRIEYDFDKKEPYLEIRMPAYPKLAIADKPDSGILPDDQPDLRDSMLKSFIQELGLGGKQLVLQYPSNNTDNSVARIYLYDKSFDTESPYLFLLPDGTVMPAYINALNAEKGFISLSTFKFNPAQLTEHGPCDDDGYEWKTIHHPQTSAYTDIRLEWNEDYTSAKVIYKD